MSHTRSKQTQHFVLGGNLCELVYFGDVFYLKHFALFAIKYEMLKLQLQSFQVRISLKVLTAVLLVNHLNNDLVIGLGAFAHERF